MIKFKLLTDQIVQRINTLNDLRSQINIFNNLKAKHTNEMDQSKTTIRQREAVARGQVVIITKIAGSKSVSRFPNVNYRNANKTYRLSQVD